MLSLTMNTYYAITDNTMTMYAITVNIYHATDNTDTDHAMTAKAIKDTD